MQAYAAVPEVLAPAGSRQALEAAVRAGADAVYLGLTDFNARRTAGNFDAAALQEAAAFCRARGVKCYLAFNTELLDGELPRAEQALRAAGAAGVDAVIVQDLAAAALVRRCVPGAALHASTQMSVHSPAGIRQLAALGFSRAILAREMSLAELRAAAKESPIELEVFVHGALCMSVSGQCYMSAFLGGRSGNRGLCAGPCRLPFSAARCPREGDFHLSLKDHSHLSSLPALREAGITKDDFVLEIGPGIGTMTQILCENAREVAAVEIDKNLIPILAETLAPYDNVTVINEDILKVDVRKLAEEKNGGRPIKVVANLPYYITTPIIMGLFESHVPLESITIMVQKEVAQRMQVGPGTKDYGALSLAVQFYADAQIVLKVPASCFMPRPNVDSAVIKLVRHEDAPVKVKDEQFMFRVIRAAFNQRRKTLANSLANSSELNGSGHACTREDVTTALEAMGLPAGIRGEALTLAQFGELADRLVDMH